MTKPIHWGILGPGRIARKFADGLKVLPGAKLLAVASRSLDRANQFGEEYHVPHRYGSYEALVQNPAVDVVYVATPHVAHHAHTLLCLNHRKAVLCEKPLAINTGQVRDMVELARQNGTFLMEGLWTRFLPSMQRVLDLVAEGAIGEVKSLQADFGFRAEFKPEGRLFNPALGGGSLLDIGIYPLFLATTLFGKPSRVKVLAHLGSTRVDEQCSVSLGYENGALATLHTTLLASTPTEAYLAGTRGGIRMHARWLAPTSFTLHQDGQEPVLIQPDSIGNGYQYEAEAVMQCLREGRTECPQMSHRDSLLLMEVMDWVREEAGIRYPEDGIGSG